MKDKKRIIMLLLGPALFALCCFAIPESAFPTLASRAAIGTLAWMALWWVTGPIDYAVTAFLPIAINALVQMCDMSSIISQYASTTVLLLLGASILTVSWEKTGLDKRIAVTLLGLIGDNLRNQLIFWFLLSTVLSAVLPNAVVCATITPIAISMLKYVGHDDIANNKIGSKLILYIAYGAGLGGLASPLGGAMNLVVVKELQTFTGQEYMYVSWVVRFAPIMLVLLIVNIIFLIRDVKKGETLGGSREYFKQQQKELPKMNMDEILSLSLFLVATVLAFTRQFYKELIPGLEPAYAFVICAILSFLIPKCGGKSERLMVWKSVQTKIVWEMIYIFAGGLALGELIKGSGASDAIGDLVAKMGLTGGIVTVLIIVTVTLLMSDVTSNTATAAVCIPIVISMMKGIDESLVIPFVYIATVGVNLSYMLPTSIRAIPVGYGLKPGYMFKEGIKITIVTIITMTILCYALLKYWPAFSTV